MPSLSRYELARAVQWLLDKQQEYFAARRKNAANAEAILRMCKAAEKKLAEHCQVILREERPDLYPSSLPAREGGES